MFRDVSNCCGSPSPRKKMRFFAVFWLRFCSVSAFFRVRCAQAFQNLGSFSCSVHDIKQVRLVWKNVMVQVDTWQIRLQIYIILFSPCCSRRARKQWIPVIFSVSQNSRQLQKYPLFFFKKNRKYVCKINSLKGFWTFSYNLEKLQRFLNISCRITDGQTVFLGGYF